MRKTVIAAAAAFAVASGAMIGQAAAADFDFMPAPPPVFVPTWAGFYIGGHVGYGEADFDVRKEFDYYRADPNNAGGFLPGLLNTFESGLNPNGLIGGVQGGYNWQVNSLVFGIEGDVSFADWGASRTTFDILDGDLDNLDNVLGNNADAFGRASADVDMLASVRGRLGFAMNNLLIYGTGGVAWADATARAAIEFDDNTNDALPSFRRTGKESFDDIGFVVGAGLGWMVIPQTFSVGLEGLYYFFDEKKTLIDDTLELANGDEIAIRATASINDAWVIRARADFHF